VQGPIASIYRWKGEVVEEQEWYCHFKTTLERLPRLQARLREVHPYEVPEIIALSILWGEQQYLDWIQKETGGDE
jgi:periplasmic divalent cation tolerance protein